MNNPLTPTDRPLMLSDMHRLAANLIDAVRATFPEPTFPLPPAPLPVLPDHAPAPVVGDAPSPDRTVSAEYATPPAPKPSNTQSETETVFESEREWSEHRKPGAAGSGEPVAPLPLDSKGIPYQRYMVESNAEGWPIGVIDRDTDETLFRVHCQYDGGKPIERLHALLRRASVSTADLTKQADQLRTALSAAQLEAGRGQIAAEELAKARVEAAEKVRAAADDIPKTLADELSAKGMPYSAKKVRELYASLSATGNGEVGRG